MSVNKELNHIVVLPEDDANRQLANGFFNHFMIDARRVKILPPARGWRNTIKFQETDLINDLGNIKCMHLLLLIDFDDKIDQRMEMYNGIKTGIDKGSSDRVYLLGSLHEPEILKKEFNMCSFEKIGGILAGDCFSGDTKGWDTNGLIHNRGELSRLISDVKPFICG
ncbi:MAG: hypothetical protein ACYCYL_12435 [Acidithiobacillus sp.]